MKINVIKKIGVELSAEEKETIQKARDIIRNLMETMADNQCDWIECYEDYGDNANYTLTQIDEADTIIDCISHIVEMY